MDLDQVMRMLKGKSEVKLVKFVSDKGPNSCEKCLAFHGKVFRADDPEKPELPIHPHCRCRYEELSESEVKSFQNEVLEVKDQVVALGNKVAARATQLLEEFKREINAYSVTALAKGAVTAFPLLLNTTEIVREKKEFENRVASKADTAQINALFTGLQISYAAMQKIKYAAQTVQQEMRKLEIDIDVVELYFLSDPMHGIESLLFKDWHYNRLRTPLQQPWALPQSPEEAEALGYTKAPDSQNLYHQFNGQKGNVKYYHPLTGQEAVFDVNGRLVTDPKNIGTYNYFPPTDFYTMVCHFFVDMVPYYKWGNSLEDNTPGVNRLFGPDILGRIRENVLEILGIQMKNKEKAPGN